LYGSKNPKPVPPVNFSEFAGGSLVAVMGVLMAVIERYKSGKGQVVDANITEGVAYTGSWLMGTQNSVVWGKPKGQNLLVITFCLLYLEKIKTYVRIFNSKL